MIPLQTRKGRALIWPRKSTKGAGRTNSITDGIFAFAMTLLVLTVVIPEVPQEVAEWQYDHILLGLTPALLHFALGFLVLSALWLFHHHIYDYVAKVDPALMWYNLFTLLFVCLVPFSTQLATTYSEYPASIIVFDLNIFLISCCFSLQWHRLKTRPGLLDPKMPKDQYHYTNVILGLLTLISLVAILLAYLNIPYSGAIYLLLLTLPYMEKALFGKKA